MKILPYGRVATKVVTQPPQHMRQTVGKLPTSKVAAMIAVTQAVAAKTRKRRGPTVSVDTTTASTEIETMVVEEDDSTSPDSPALKVVETPRKAADEEGAAKHSAGKTG